ncbi:MAG: hypothetical protein RL557_594 [archaeon]|jgi:ubiquinone/menaquinone biosynthesis C-methylase UbiE
MTNSISIISKSEFLKKNKKPNQKKVWNAIASSWEENRKNKIYIVEEFLKNKKGKIIDIGCGSGRNMIPHKEIEYYGIDFSKQQIAQTKEYAKKNKIKTKLFTATADKLPKTCKNNIFDYGLLIATLHCIETKIKRKKALQQLYRVLKPNAEALITVWNAEDQRFKEVNNHGPVYLSWKENNIPHMRYYYLFNKQELIDLIKETEFTILKFYEPEQDRFSKKNWIIKVRK